MPSFETVRSILLSAGLYRPSPLSAPVRRTTNAHMRTRPIRPVIDNRSARNLFLAPHALSENPRHEQPRADLLFLIDQIGFVQLDSINTVARARELSTLGDPVAAIA